MLTLNHVNLRTADLKRLCDWYGRVLGLKPGWRPDFPFPGHWLYAGDKAVVHLVGVESQPAGADPSLQHFAFDSNGTLAAFLKHLEALEISARVRRIPGAEITQVNLTDPDGNALHVDFAEA